MRKKAQMERMSYYIIGVVIFILLIVGVTRINAALREMHMREICMASMAATELSSKATVGVFKPTIDCPMQKVQITKKDISTKKGIMPDFNARKKVAQAMYDTWFVGGRGDYRTFPAGFASGAGVYCLVYARVDFEKGISLPMMTDMKNWMTINTPSTSSQTYLSYISFSGRKAFAIVNAPDPKSIKETYDIDPQKNYYSVYMLMVKNKWNVFGNWLIDSTGYDQIASSLKEKESMPMVIFVPEDQFGNIGCEYLLN